MSAEYNFNEDNISIAASGTHVSDELDVYSFTGATVLIEGDTNSTNLTVTVKAKLDESDTNFSHYTEYKELDLTSYDDNRKVLVPLDVLELNDVKLEITNNAASSTSVSYRVGVAN